ncbi:hypothetical protein ACFOQM_23305 [Paenibacillus sp. GCM10012307]|uniref:Uncharacterized protein n=1 Tax=Paenibacillus roseus TaxID=2798579 RepID=A0A934JC92_9BACL|nr:hypothetical protein [Paenibacillus roseus]MBJ6364153.1 hypothetical protein [Paenibacillus roseus]
MIRDAWGEEIPFGKTAKRVEENFMLATTLPSWVSVTGTGTPTHTISPLESSYGYLEVKTSAAADDTAILNIFPNGISFSPNIREIRLEFESLFFSNGTPNINVFLEMTNSGKTKGFAVSSTPTEGDDTRIKTFTSSGAKTDSVLKQHPLLNLGEWKRRKNLELRLRSDGTVILLECGNVFYEKRFSASEMDIGGSFILRPRISIRNIPGSTTRHFRVSKVALTVIHN